MIIRRRLDFVRLVQHLGPQLFSLLCYDTAVTLLYVFGWQWVSIGELPLPLLGSAIAIIVTFRNNAAYDRWWEARGLWGSVVNNSRSFARGLLVLTNDAGLQTRLVRHQIAYALALRCSLLGLPPWVALEPYLPPDLLARLRSKANVPAAIQTAMARDLATARLTGGVDSIGAATLDRTLSDLANAQGGLERIKKTPLPRQYNQFPQVFVGVYCLLLPVGLVHDLGYLTPIGSTVIGFMFMALDRIGRDLEDPFEGTLHDIPMQAITRTIEIDLLQTIDAGPAPAAVTEREGVLW
ncbi:bestrophin family protein [Acidisphaera sp. L21]|uniref:bestrophin family protein n=1 Tax=Acidisphaera sp. L21 TaxID=1641851 RepID=UPI00131CC093|nr:bestrophin family ion channel [Acidisphaera sp. L21]